MTVCVSFPLRIPDVDVSMPSQLRVDGAVAVSTKTYSTPDHRCVVRMRLCTARVASLSWLLKEYWRVNHLVRSQETSSHECAGVA